MAAELCSPTGHEYYDGRNGCSDPLDLTTQFTVPNDCDCLVVAISSYFGSSAQPVTGIDWDDDGTPQALTEAVRHDDTAGNQALIWYLLDPTTGQKTLNIDWANTPSESVGVSCIYLKNVDSTGTIVGTDGENDTDPMTMSIASDNGDQDFMVGVVYEYTGTAGTFDAGTQLENENPGFASPCTDDSLYALGYDTTGSPFTITYNRDSSAPDSSMAAALFKGTAGATALPPVRAYGASRMMGALLQL